MPGPPVHWEQLSVVRPKVSPVTSVIWALGAGGVLILVRIVYASDVCNVVKYATVSQPGQGVSSPSLLTAQHFFIGQIQILNTSLKWQHWLNSIDSSTVGAWWYLTIVYWSKHCRTWFLYGHLALDTPHRGWCYQIPIPVRSVRPDTCGDKINNQTLVTDQERCCCLRLEEQLVSDLNNFLQFMIFVVYP